MSVIAQPGVRVAWDPNPETNIAGYRLYYGETGAGFTNVLDTGAMTTGSVTNLSFATDYFFYVTAYNTFDLESDPSTVLYYTTPDRIPISVTTEETLLIVAPTEFHLPATLEGDAGAGLEIDWQQVSGPAPVTIQEANSLDPTVLITTTGEYAFRVQVSDDLSADQSELSIRVIPPAEGSGTTTSPEIYPLELLFDGIAIHWSSKSNATYDIGFKRDLNSPFWILLATDIPSDGDVYTYWVDDSADLLGAGFYTVFETQ